MESALRFLPIVFSSQVVLDIEQNQIRICSEIMADSLPTAHITTLPVYHMHVSIETSGNFDQKAAKLLLEWRKFRIQISRI